MDILSTSLHKPSLSTIHTAIGRSATGGNDTAGGVIELFNTCAPHMNTEPRRHELVGEHARNDDMETVAPPTTTTDSKIASTMPDARPVTPLLLDPLKHAF